MAEAMNCRCKPKCSYGMGFELGLENEQINAHSTSYLPHLRTLTKPQLVDSNIYDKINHQKALIVEPLAQGLT